MNVYVPRTCMEVAQHRQDNPAERLKPKPLREFGDSPAIVLLGAPGAGKTELFKREAKFQTEAHEGQEETQKAGCYVTARDFVTFDERPEWRETTLFIDGLDEMRAGASDQRTPFDRIRGKLDSLGRPPFRLSCREADWLGATDRSHLERVSSNGEVLVLRLAPLSQDGIREILSAHQGIEDIEEFIVNAQRIGIDALLENAQTLGMLADAVVGGNWPQTRKKTFELACLKLLLEQNPEHQLGAPPQHSDEDLLDAAGRLCALLLFSGRAGCRAMAGQADADSISLSEISRPSQEILNRTIHTKLFNVGNGLATPIHRHIAEFLAGRHLAGLIGNGLPVRRVLALMTGEDGGVVSELRGLSAWLAAHSKMGRSELIERDPEGVVLYGDVKQFSVDEKRRILDCLGREAERDPWSIASNRELDARWEDLATPDMWESFAELLTNEPTNDARQSVVNAALIALNHGRYLPRLQSTLMNLARDQARWLGTRELALDAYIKQAGQDRQFNQELQDLLDAVHSGTVSDPNDQLLGRLLRHLYPNELSSSNIGKYFRTSKNESFLGEYLFFWINTFMGKTTEPAQVAEALDSFVQFCGNSSSINQSHQLHPNMRELPILLLGTYFKHFGVKGEIDKKRLFGWLQISANISGSQGSGNGAQEVRDWFSNHPEQYKAIFKMAADGSMLFWQIPGLLFHVTPPRDFSSWCIDQALKEKDNNLAREYLYEAMGHLDAGKQCDGLSREELEMRIAERPFLLSCYRKRQNEQRQLIEERSRRKRLVPEKQQEKQAEQARWCYVIESIEQEIQRNHCPPHLLHKLASVYQGVFVDSEGKTGPDRISDLVGGDDRLTNLVLYALRKSLERIDLPRASEVIRLATENQQHSLALPFVAGLEEIANKLKAGQPPLDENGMRLALAIHFHDPSHMADVQKWYSLILAERPDVYAKSLIQAFRLTVRKGVDRFTGLHQLAYDPSHEKVAQIAAIPLLNAFPAHCTLRWLKMLKWILIAALKNCEQEKLLEIVERKLSLKSLNVGQRIYWLAAGVLSSSSSFTQPLAKALSGRGSERRIRHLVNFLGDEIGGDLRAEITSLDLPAKQVLIGFIGKSYRPETRRSEMDAANLLETLINQVSSSCSLEASEILNSLLQDTLLKPWRPRLRHAAQRQREVRREACFTHATPKQVQQTLDNIRPADSADLAALGAPKASTPTLAQPETG